MSNVHAFKADDTAAPVEVKMMTLQEWINVPDHPKQRDTEIHAAKAKKKHLKHKSDDHQIVKMGVMPDGSCYKLDGHTRCYLWQHGELDCFENLIVLVFNVTGQDHLIELYEQNDSKFAVKNATDEIHGCFRLFGIEPYSGEIRKGQITTALQAADAALMDAILSNKGAKPTQIMVQEWAPEIQLLDEVFCLAEKKINVMSSGFRAAALLTFRKHGDEAKDFWVRYLEGKGVKQGQSYDGVGRLEKVAQERKNTVSNREMIEHQRNAALRCFENFRKGEMFFKVHPINGRDYLTGKSKKLRIKS